MTQQSETLTFDLTGDICLAAQEGTLTIDDLPDANAGALGPLLELRHIRPDFLVDQVWLTNKYTALLDNMGSSLGVWYEPEFGRQGYISVNKLHGDHTAWPDFMIRSKRAAKSIGFSDDHAGKMAAAIGELYSNIIEHSQKVETGYVVFCAQKSSFEFVVADAGIGVLSSLRSNPGFGHITDSGTALELALSQGVSRHTEPGRGCGFQPLFVGLANISRLIRFRSDDYSRELITASDHEIVSVTRQLSMLRGFFCAVLCGVGRSP